MSGGRYVTLDGKQGVIYERTPEEEAFSRWQRHEFLDLERQIAKAWRRNVTNIDHTDNYALFSGFYGSFRKPKTLADAKHIADALVSLLDEEKALLFGLSMLGVPAGRVFVVGICVEAARMHIGVDHLVEERDL